MGERSDLSVSREWKGTTIHLDGVYLGRAQGLLNGLRNQVHVHCPFIPYCKSRLRLWLPLADHIEMRARASAWDTHPDRCGTTGYGVFHAAGVVDAGKVYEVVAIARRITV